MYFLLVTPFLFFQSVPHPTPPSGNARISYSEGGPGEQIDFLPHLFWSLHRAFFQGVSWYLQEEEDAYSPWLKGEMRQPSGQGVSKLWTSSVEIGVEEEGVRFSGGKEWGKQLSKRLRAGIDC